MVVENKTLLTKQNSFNFICWVLILRFNLEPFSRQRQQKEMKNAKITTFNSRRLFNFDSYLFAIISFTHSLSLLLVAPNTQLMHTHTHPLSKCSTLHTPNPSLSHTHSNQTHYLALSLSLLFSFSWCANSLSVSKIQQYFVRLFVSNCISVSLLPAYVVVGAHSTILYP